MSVPAPIVAPLSQVLLSGARQLTLPLLGTSASIGASMFLGDVACQWIVQKQARTRLMEEHLEKQAAAQTAAAAGGVATAAVAAVILPLPDFDAMLAYRPPAPFSHAPAGTLPSLSDSALSRAAPLGTLPALPESVLSLAPSWWNSRRSLSMLASGLVFSGPWQFLLMQGGERFFPGRGARAIGSKMLLNFTQAPLGISATFYLTNRFQGKHDEEAFERIRNDMPSTFALGSLYWPFVSFLNLRFVDLAYRPIVGAMAGSVWNIFVSSQANTKVAQHSTEDAPPLPNFAAAASASATAAAADTATNSL